MVSFSFYLFIYLTFTNAYLVLVLSSLNLMTLSLTSSSFGLSFEANPSHPYPPNRSRPSDLGSPRDPTPPKDFRTTPVPYGSPSTCWRTRTSASQSCPRACTNIGSRHVRHRRGSWTSESETKRVSGWQKIVRAARDREGGPGRGRGRPGRSLGPQGLPARPQAM